MGTLLGQLVLLLDTVRGLHDDFRALDNDARLETHLGIMAPLDHAGLLAFWGG